MSRVRVRRDRSGGHGSGAKGTTAKGMARRAIIGCSIFVCGMMVVWLDRKQTSALQGMSRFLEHSMPMSTDTTNHEQASKGPLHARGELRPYCEGTTDYFQEEKLESAISQARFFHTQGGSLKSVQSLMDSNIDATVKQLNVTFIPKGMQKSQGTQDVTQYLKSYYAQNYDPRGGYGKLLPGEYTKENPMILEGRYVQVVDPDATRERWDYSLGPQDLACPNLLRMGGRGADGTKWYCQPMQKQGKPSSNENNNHLRRLSTDNARSSKNDCHIISIGGNDNWTFELQVVKMLPGCVTHTFDCTLENGTPKQKPDRDDIRFYNYCIDSKERKDEHGRHYITYFDIVQKAQLKVPPHMFKIDVEGYEYDVFSSMIQQANSDDEMTIITKNSDGTTNTAHHQPSYWLPQQIMVELHWATRMTGVSWMPRSRTTAEIALLSNMMFTGGGYMPTFRRWIRFCPSCIEVLYFRTLC
ncbi:expressed unknown protein [Seminavis robusta]|uniref:Methyltransferase domain-containing protein n=1 Tax=Seminavis robusta TaxID=568900 RepID=A0A9N8HT95_9STRA|nr:expressed unknown protein [Seminavis robusta]|eukprot:Sro1632_g287310.1 n/a (470) ;mRNA; r:22793-24202